MKLAKYIKDEVIQNCHSLRSSFLEKPRHQLNILIKMVFKVLLSCVLFAIIYTDAHIVRRDVSPTPTSSQSQPDFLEPFLKNLEEFKNCLDKSLAKAVNQVNEKQLQPVFTVTGDALNRVSKAFDDLTAPKKKTTFEDFE